MVEADARLCTVFCTNPVGTNDQPWAVARNNTEDRQVIIYSGRWKMQQGAAAPMWTDRTDCGEFGKRCMNDDWEKGDTYIVRTA